MSEREVVLGRLRDIERRLSDVYDPHYQTDDDVQGVLDLVTTCDLPFLIDWLDREGTAT